MELIQEKEISQLIEHQHEHCVSIFIPTNIAGKEVFEEKDKHNLKTKWNECRRNLEDQDVAAQEIEQIAKPIKELLNDEEFWRHQSHGLAVFASANYFEYHRLPIKFVAHTYIANHFYIRSLAPALSSEQKFFILALQLGEVKLYEASEYSLVEIEMKDLLPANINDVVGYDYEEKHLQVRNQQPTDAGGALFHGHGAANKDEKKEILKYFQAVDRGLNDYLHEKTAPLLVFSQDYLFPIYQEANSYTNLYDQVISGNPNDVNEMGLHEKAVETIRPYLETKKRRKQDQYEEAEPALKTDLIHDIVPFAFEGKIDTLFLENRAEIWGNFDQATQKVAVEKQHLGDNFSLSNLAAKKVLEEGGTVYLVDAAFMPGNEAKASALLRYS